MKAEIIEYILKNIIEKSNRHTISAYKWNEPLILNNKKIHSIYWDGTNFTIVSLDGNNTESLHYKDDLEVKPNKNLIKLFF